MAGFHKAAWAKTLSQTFPTKAEAVTWARLKEAEIDVAERPVEVVELATITLADLMERYLDTVTPTKKSAYQERYRLNRLMREPLVNLTLGSGPIKSLSLMVLS